MNLQLRSPSGTGTRRQNPAPRPGSRAACPPSHKSPNSLLALLALLALLPLFALLTTTPAFAADANTTTANRYLEHVKILASSEMRGRGAGTPELDRAAQYIADQFASYRVQPAGSDAYYQPFTVTTGAEMGDSNRLIAHSNGGDVSLGPGKDWTPINFSASGEVSGNVVFAGYGITAEEKGYDDYAAIDVTDKIVIVLRYEPPGFTKDDNRKRRRYTHHANLISKAINARNRGAKAVILVQGRAEISKRGELIQFGSVAGPDNSGILMLQVSNDVVEKWLRRSNHSLETLQRDIDGAGDNPGKPRSFALGQAFSLDLAVDVKHKQAEVRNVVGYLPGRTNEYIILGAHYDHLGLGDESSLAPDKIGEVHHGADDNASGVAGLLEIARRFGRLTERPRRGLLLMAFAGEEIGLLGSAHWADNPTKPLENAVAMLNMDMIGRIGGGKGKNGKIYVGGVGTAEPLEPLVKRLAADVNFRTDFSRSGYSASDHTSFAAKRIPVLFFFSGLHSDYHKPSDTWDKINAPAAVRLVDLVARITAELRGSNQELAFVKEAPAAQGPHGQAPAGGSGGGYGPYFGSIPDFGEIPNGVRFADIRPDSPADKGGLKAGDILTRFDGKPIQNLYDFTYALRDSEVGQTVKIQYLRNDQEQTATVTLEPRR